MTKPASKRAKPAPRAPARRSPRPKGHVVRPLRTSGDEKEQGYLALFAEIERAAGPRVRLLAEQAAARATESFVRRLGHHMSSRVTAVNRPFRQIAAELEKPTIDLEAIRAAVSDGYARSDALWKLMERARDAVLSQRPHFAVERLAPLVDDACARVASLLAGSDVEPVFSLDVGARLSLHADHAMIVDALAEIMKNAAEAYRYAGRRGEVSVKARARGRDRSEIEIVVADRGRGMEPESLAHFFVPFSTSRPEASGVGCLVARSRVEEAHGGALTAESTAGVGTRVRIVLPAKQAPVQPARRLTIDEMFDRGAAPPLEQKSSTRKSTRAARALSAR